MTSGGRGTSRSVGPPRCPGWSHRPSTTVASVARRRHRSARSRDSHRDADGRQRRDHEGRAIGQQLCHIVGAVDAAAPGAVGPASCRGPPHRPARRRRASSSRRWNPAPHRSPRRPACGSGRACCRPCSPGRRGLTRCVPRSSGPGGAGGADPSDPTRRPRYPAHPSAHQRRDPWQLPAPTGCRG